VVGDGIGDTEVSNGPERQYSTLSELKINYKLYPSLTTFREE